MLRNSILCLFSLVPALPAAGNPIFAAADPHAVYLEGVVWIYPTYSEKGKNFWAFKLNAQKKWEKTGPILDLKDVKWLRKERQRGLGPWAPCIAEKDGRFYFYYSVGPQSPGNPSRIGVAVGTSPSGPFEDSGKPLLTGGDGFEAIDPMVFEDPASGKFYFYVGGSAGAKLRVFELDETMVGFKKEIPVENPRHFTEGAFMHLHDGEYHLTYSHGNWKDATYSVHHSTAESPTGPWRYRGVILSSNATNKGPGHHSIFQIPSSGQWYIAYHRWEDRSDDGPYSGGRVTALDKLEHAADGLIKEVVMTD